jgi:OOP family OmpA-OmpF porin
MRWNLILGVLSLSLWLGPAARLDAQTIPNDRFSANRFTPAPGAGNYVMVDGALVAGDQTPSAGLFVDYAHRPFVLFTATCTNGNADKCSVKDSRVAIVAYQLAFDAMTTFTLWQRLQLGLVIPVIGTSGDSFFATTPNRTQHYVDIRGGEALGLGDPRLSAKVRILGQGSDGFSLAAIGFVTAPLGQATAKGRSIGDESLTGGGHLAAEYGAGRLRFGVNAGGVDRPNRELLSTKVGPELIYGAGGSFQATPLVRVIGEVTGATHLTSRLDENPIEARVASELTTGDFAILGGVGTGLVSGVGVPVFRVLAGVSYRPQGLDGDHDGVSDNKDACPTEKEDRDGFEDDDGCPDLDNDNDGIPDAADKCPDKPEDKDGFQDDDGCPDNDNDNDGIPDGYDSCPNEPEDKDGDRDEDGCPDNDRDRDGVPDDVDKCPDVPEDTDGFGDEDGCPETDYDGDGIPDDEDQCPDQPEDIDGVEDQDGCPEGGKAPAPAKGGDRTRKRTRG